MRKNHVATAAFRIISSLAVAAPLLLGGATAAHATDSITPAVITGGGTTDIAYSVPAMVISGNGVDITAAGPDGSLYDYWAENGTSNWAFAAVALPGSVG